MGSNLKQLVRQQFDRQARYLSLGSTVDDPGVHEKVLALLELQGDEKILEVACGTGLLAAFLAPRVKEILGIDLSEGILKEAVKIREERRLGNLEFRLSDGDELPFNVPTFNISICKCSFPYFASPLRVVKEMKRVTRPGGKILIVEHTPPDDSIKREYYAKIMILRSPGHLRVFSRDEIRGLLQEAGLEPLREESLSQKYLMERWLKEGGGSQKDLSTAKDLLLKSIPTDAGGFKVSLEKDMLYMFLEHAFYLSRVPG